MGVVDISKISWTDYKRDTIAAVFSKKRERDKEKKTMANGFTRPIPVAKLREHPKNVRKTYDDIDELTASVRENGVLQNLTVVPDPATKGYYLVVIGNRRLHAARRAGLDYVQCSVVDMTEAEQLATMLCENMQRRDLNVIEQAQGVQMTLDLGFDINELSKKTGLSKKAIKERKKIADLDLDYSEVQEDTMKQITIADMEKLAGIEDKSARQEILKAVGTSDFTYKVTSQIQKEKNEKWREKMIMALDKYADEVYQNPTYGHYEQSYYFYASDPDAELPEFDDDHRYVYRFNGANMLMLFSIRKDMEEEADAELEEEDDDEDESGSGYEKVLEKRNTRLKREEQRKETAKTLKEMRMNYMKSRTESKYLAYNRMLYWLTYIYVGTEDVDVEIYAELIGKSEEEIELYDLMPEDAAKDAEFDPANVIRLIYASLENYSTEGLPCGWDGSYRQNERLDVLYEFLKECGYEISDTERAILDGTSDLYEKEEY